MYALHRARLDGSQTEKLQVEAPARPQAILIEYKDGTRGAALNLVEAVSEFAFAATLDGQTEPESNIGLLYSFIPNSNPVLSRRFF